MRAALAVLIACACRGSEAPPPSPSAASASGSARGVDLCELASRALDGVKCARVADEASAARTKQQIDALIGPTGRGGAFGSPQLQTACAHMLAALERDSGKLACTLSLTAEESALVRARAGTAPPPM